MTPDEERMDAAKAQWSACEADKALRDEVAKGALLKLLGEGDCTFRESAIDAFNCAEAFMAERKKRDGA